MSMRCPGCDSRGAEPFLDGGEVPVLANVLHDRREDAVAAPRARLRLALCPECGLVANPDFDPDRVRYQPAYENALHFSPRFRRYAEDLARDLAVRHLPPAGTAVEIGCGDGHFLGLLCDAAGATGRGFDPSHDPARSATGGARVTIDREEWPGGRADGPADLVVARHVLEHVARPLEFLRSLRRGVAGRPGAALYVEVPNGLAMLERGLYWDLVYEHVSYFTPAALADLAAAAGFRPTAVEETFDGQFLALHAVADDARGPAPAPRRADVPRLASEFGRRRDLALSTWAGRLREHSGAGRRVAAWGAGAKGVAFLNAVPGAARSVAAIVDLNPRKRGKHVTGAGTPILAPADLPAVAPDVVLVMNPIYREEITSALRDLGLSPAVEEVA